MKLLIILVGPICSGKSSVAQIFSNKLQVPHFGLDMLERQYGPEVVMDLDKSRIVIKKQ